MNEKRNRKRMKESKGKKKIKAAKTNVAQPSLKGLTPASGGLKVKNKPN